MAKKKDNGNFVLSAMEQDLLSILLGQQQGVYGLEILKRMNTASKKFGRSEITIGSLYPTLKRMEEQGLITGRWGESIPGEESGGARRRYYSISADGETALRTTWEFRMQLFQQSGFAPEAVFGVMINHQPC